MGMMGSRQRSDRRMWIARTAAVLVFLMGAAVLFGWVFNFSSLKSVYPGWARMAPDTALCFLIAAASLWCVAGDKPSAPGGPLWRRLPYLGGGAIALLAGLKLIEFLTGWNFGTDYIFSNRPSVTSSPVRMAEATALDFFLFGGVLLLIHNRRWVKTFEWLVLTGGCVAWLGLSRYFFGTESLTLLRPMALHAGSAFLLLNAGALCLRDDGLMALLRTNHASGQTLRRLLLPALTLLWLMNWAEFQAERAGWFTPGSTMALFTTANMIFFGTLLWFNAALLSQAETKRKAAEETLHASRERPRAIVESSDDAIISKT